MGTPKIKMYQVPPGNWLNTSGLPTDETYVEFSGGWTPPSGFSTAASPRDALLIERMMDKTKRGLHPEWGSGYYPAEFMIRMKPLSSGSRTFEIDYSYHSVASGLTFASGSENPFLCGMAYNGTVIPRKEFASQGSRSVPPFLALQVFIEEPITWFGYGNLNQRSDKFTFCPQQGGYTANIAGEAPPGDSPWFGRQWNLSLGNQFGIHTSGQADDYRLNYLIDTAQKRIVFSDYFYTRFVLKVPYVEASGYNDVYIRAYVVRTNNVPSQVWYDEVESYLYYALPHQDIVADRGVGEVTIFGATRSDASINRDSGIIVVPADPMPPSGYPCVVSSGFWYHKWDRLANDDVFNLQMHGLVSGQWRYKNQSEGTITPPIHLPAPGNEGQYPYSKTGDEQRIPLHQDTLAIGDDVPPNWYWAWSDIKIVNEGDAEMRSIYIDPVPRGVTEGGEGYEEILPGESGLLNRDRPWDHHEGTTDETAEACFVRPTREWLWYDVSGVKYDAELRKTRGQKIAKWFLSSPTITYGGDTFHYFVLPDPDSDLDLQTQNPETHDSITLKPIVSGYDPSDYANQEHYLFARIQHSLVNPNTNQPIATATGGKAWTVQVKGFYVLG